MMDKNAYSLLLSRLSEIAHLNSSLALLQWDQEVHMPAKAGEARSKTISYLSVLAHEKVIDLDKGKILTRLNRWAITNPKTKEAVVIRETWRSYDRERKLPAEFVEEMSALCSVAQGVWAEARKKSDFSLFLPKLERIIALKRREAEYIGYRGSPYDALLDAFEPGLTSERVSVLFDELRDFLKPFVRKIGRSSAKLPSPSIVKGKFPIDRQVAFGRMLMQKIGFDLDAGRLDESTHPFTTSFHPSDVRLTTRYDERNALYALGSTIHEMGHGLYEQGLAAEHFGTPLGETSSLGIHESQSRIWENNLGKSRAFWAYFYPKLQKQFPRPFARVPFEKFHLLLNRVEPSFIRTEADEVTYNLHIILRFEIERDLIEGRIRAKDLPRIWNAKMKEYLGVKVSDDRVGVLQDVHWSCGLIGYFPTYALGNLYAAQLQAAAKRHFPKLENDFKKGNFAPMRGWLREKIHAHGKLYSAETLIKNATGEGLRAKYFIEYLEGKYGEIYGMGK